MLKNIPDNVTVVRCNKIINHAKIKTPEIGVFIYYLSVFELSVGTVSTVILV